MNHREIVIASLLSLPLAAQPLPPGQRVLVAEADAQFEKNDCRSALPLYRRVLAAVPGDSESRYRFASCLADVALYDEAEAEFAKTAAASPRRRANALYGRAVALTKLGRKTEAVEAVRASMDGGFYAVNRLESDPDLQPLRSMPAFLALARRYLGPSYGTPASPGGPTHAQMRAGIRQLRAAIRTRHPRPHKILTAAQLDALIARSLSRVPHLDECSYYVELLRITSALGDVHTSAYPRRGASIMKKAIPIALWKFPDALRVRMAAPEYASLVGAEVLAIDGVPTAKLWPRLISDFPFENEWMSAYSIQFFLRFPDFLRGLGLSRDRDHIELRLRSVDGVESVKELPAVDRGGYLAELAETMNFETGPGWVDGSPANNPPLWLQHRDRNYWFTELPGKAMFMEFNVPRDDPAHPWAAFLDEMTDTLRREGIQRLVIDLRRNYGGWGYMAEDLVQKLQTLPEVNRPGHLFALIGRLTQSAGVVTATELERHAHAVFVGEPVGAHPNLCNSRLGNHPTQELPGTQIVFRMSDNEEQHSDALDERRFVAPDLDAPLTWSAYAAGRDPALEAALAIPAEDAATYLDDAGGRSLPPYFRWKRPTQYRAYGLVPVP